MLRRTFLMLAANSAGNLLLGGRFLDRAAQNDISSVEYDVAVGLDADSDSEPIEDTIDRINASGEGWSRWTIDEWGNLHEEWFQTYSYRSEQTGRAVPPVVVAIAVYVGAKMAGKLLAEVVDGVITSVTGASITGWGQIAAARLIGRRPPAGNALYLPCSIYPPHSGEYIRCMNS